MGCFILQNPKELSCKSWNLAMPSVILNKLSFLYVHQLFYTFTILVNPWPKFISHTLTLTHQCFDTDTDANQLSHTRRTWPRCPFGIFNALFPAATRSRSVSLVLSQHEIVLLRGFGPYCNSSHRKQVESVSLEEFKNWVFIGKHLFLQNIMLF